MNQNIQRIRNRTYPNFHFKIAMDNLKVARR